MYLKRSNKVPETILICHESFPNEINMAFITFLERLFTNYSIKWTPKRLRCSFLAQAFILLLLPFMILNGNGERKFNSLIPFHGFITFLLLIANFYFRCFSFWFGRLFFLEVAATSSAKFVCLLKECVFHFLPKCFCDCKAKLQLETCQLKLNYSYKVEFCKCFLGLGSLISLFSLHFRFVSGEWNVLKLL